MICLGTGLIIGGTVYKQDTDKKLDSWPHAEAVVVDYDSEYRRDSDGDSTIMYSEILEFEADGETYRVKSNSSSNIRPRIGAVREIAYDPVNPRNIVEKASNKMLFIILFIAGGAFAAVGLLLTVTSFVKRKS